METTESADNRTVCPMITGHHYTSYCGCNCAWYVERDNKCAIAVMAEALSYAKDCCDGEGEA